MSLVLLVLRVALGLFRLQTIRNLEYSFASVKCPDGPYHIPESFGNIAKRAFYNCKTLTDVTMPNSITSIGDESFCGCVKLKSITLSTSLVSIGQKAFYQTRLESIRIPQSLETIGIAAFADTRLTRFIVDAENKHFVNSHMVLIAAESSEVVGALNTAPNLALYGDYRTPDIVKGIGESAFEGSRALSYIEFDDSVTYIKNRAFHNCPWLYTVKMTDSINSVGVSAFSSCGKLSSVTLSTSMEEIPEKMFFGCKGLKSLSIPASVKRIGESAFEDCTALETITFGDGSALESIGAHAFYHCSELNSLTLPSTLNSIGEGCFCACSKVRNIVGNSYFVVEDGVLMSSDHSRLLLFSTAFSTSANPTYTMHNDVQIIEDGAFAFSALAAITLGQSVTSIGEYAFCGCQIETITITSMVNNIGYFALAQCTKLKTISVEGNENYMEKDGILFSKDGSCLIQFPCVSSKTHYEIQEPVTSVHDGAFACSALESISVNTVISISEKMFFKCEKLKSVTLKSGISSIGNEAFASCSLLTDVSIPDTVSSLGLGAFALCVSLKSFVIPPQVAIIEESVFYGCTALSSVTIPASVKEIGVQAFYGCSALTEVRIPGSVSIIGQYAFAYCTSLKTVYYDGTEEPLDDGTGNDANWFNGSPDTIQIVVQDNKYISNKFGKYAIHFESSFKEKKELSSTILTTIIFATTVVVLIGVEVLTRYVNKQSTEFLDATPTNNEVLAKCIKGAKYVFAVLIILGQITTIYIGFTLFLYCSLFVMVTPLTTGLSSIAYFERAQREFWQLISWCLYSIPFISILLSVNRQLISKFFSNWSAMVDLGRFVKYIDRQLSREMSIRKVCTLLGMAVMSAMSIIIAILIVTGGTLLGQVSFVIGLVSLVGPIYGALKVVGCSWLSLFYPKRLCSAQKDHTDRSTTGAGKGLEDLDEEKDKEKEKEKPEENQKTTISDPFDIRNPKEWFDFLKSDLNPCLELHNGWKWKQFIPALVFGVITLVYIGLDLSLSVPRIQRAIEVSDEIKRLKEESKDAELFWNTEQKEMIHFLSSLYHSSGYVIACTVGRLIFTVALIPFVMCTNIVSLFMNWKKIKKKTLVQWTQLIALVVIVLYFIIFCAWGIFCSIIEWSKFPSGYTPMDSFRKTITDEPPVSMCSTGQSGWDFLELAAMSMITNIQDYYSVDSISNITKEIMGDEIIIVPGIVEAVQNLIAGVDPDSTMTVPMILFQKKTEGPLEYAMAFGGARSNEDLAFMIENVMKYWFDFGIDILIPYFSVVRNFVLDTFLDRFAVIVDDIFIGFETYTESRLQNGILLVDEARIILKLLDSGIQNPAITGHTSGGLIAKAYGSKKKFPVMAFETPIFEHSKSYDLLMESNLFGASEEIGGNKMINVYSTSSMWSGVEESSTINLRTPRMRWPILPATAHETFCEMVAACATDDRYDHICSFAVGPKRFNRYFTEWGRLRGAIDPSYLEDLPEETRNNE